MSCYFRATGDSFDVDAFLASSSLVPDNVFHRGEPCQVNRERNRPFTGFAVQLTENFGRLCAQTAEVTMFLREHELELSRLSRYPGVTDIRLDFGYERDPEAAVQCDYLPPDLVALAGSLGIGIELSLYPRDDGQDEDSTTEDTTAG
jgi:hypothetical protein